MGICTSSPFMTKQNGTIMNLPVTKVAMVIQMNGKLQEFQQPITAGEILIQNPDFFICSSEAMNVNSLVPQLAKDEILQLGQLYFLLPVSKLNTPLSLQDMCALAVKASTALNDYCYLSTTLSKSGRGFKKMQDCHTRDLNPRPEVFESPLPL
ncbi:uncharacterized protein LOC132062205 [Lycium ferocissimum]|uniref:uncharacterized protein LOC132062205 n=1 Tax=Lycium ferocissimum TaxID=112874 RepID=UPI0028156CF0|nr:uncharacterized protein LOC132062205 [Lycium ferocissimum]